jgi:hypothetical protein
MVEGINGSGSCMGHGVRLHGDQLSNDQAQRPYRLTEEFMLGSRAFIK